MWLLTGKKLKKITGEDLFYYEMKRMQQTGGKVFFMGSNEDTLAKISDRAKYEFPNIKLKTYSPPYKAEFSDEENNNIIAEINSFKPDVLFVGMTAPKQEKWAYQHFERLKVGHVCCIGAVFDFYAGTVNRAPQWLIKIGLELFYRLLREPRRMWRRYLIGNIKFIWLIFKQKKNMKILITGNLGYVGPGLVKELRRYHPNATLIGYDIGYFAKHITNTSLSPESFLDIQYYGDVRQFPENILSGVNTVVYLAAISNDPIGNKFEEATLDINYKANIEIAKMAKRQGVSKYVFASSCSVYGSAEDAPRKETSALNPLTAYAKSKVFSEEALEGLANKDFQMTCLRFATACGMSERLRLDLILNDFVAGAVTAGKITILSDGIPWRPLIHVLDMARAIRWAHERSHDSGGAFLVMNTGSNEWNYQIKDLALATQQLLPHVDVSINKDAAPDKRSYRVNFDLFRKLAPGGYPQYGLIPTVKGLVDGLTTIGFKDHQYHQSHLIRLNVINDLMSKSQLDH